VISITLTDEQAEMLFHLLDMHERCASEQEEQELAHTVRRKIEDAEDMKGGAK